jgi:hypothetical protein
MTPNSEPTVRIPDTMIYEAPALWSWITEHALHLERSFYRMEWLVWLPLGENE